MTSREMSKYLGKTGTLLVGFGNITVPVKITDVRNQYFGRVDVLIVPFIGEGEAWVDRNRIVLHDTEEEAG